MIRTYDEIINDTINRCNAVLTLKHNEYATNDDDFRNFNVASMLSGLDRKKTLGIMMAKHTSSVFDLINSKDTVDLDVWDEKICDHINYLLILRAMVELETEEGEQDDSE